MYECKYSEAKHTDGLGEIVTCLLYHCRCEHNGEKNDICLGFKMKKIGE